MTEGQRIFLIAAKEASFTRAAEKAFVTPQCLSDHIRRLERQYHAKLFVRKPKLQLTKEGLVLQRWLQQIQTMEQGMVSGLVPLQVVKRRRQHGRRNSSAVFTMRPATGTPKGHRLSQPLQPIHSSA